MIFYYFYKITNSVNEKFYYGVHKTNNIDDGYMGSGIAIKKAYKKYGKESFRKDILHYFSNEDEMYEFEEQIVNDKLVSDTQCYNMVVGGKSNKTYRKLSELAAVESKREDVIEKKRKASIEYWNTGDVDSKKNKVSEGVKRYWRTGDVDKKRERQCNIQKEKYIKNPDIKNKISAGLKNYWSVDVDKKKQTRSESVKNSKRHKEGMAKLKARGIFKGYNNPDFLKRWKKIYDEDSRLICDFLINSNLPDDFIIKFIFKKKVKTYRLLAYYKGEGLLPKSIDIELKNRFLNFNNNSHKDGISKKTIFCKGYKYNICILFRDFFDDLPNLISIMKDDKLSDSCIVSSKITNNYFQKIDYFIEMGILGNKRVVDIRVGKIVKGKQFTVPAKKTKFDVIFKTADKIIIDKELNEYEINDNGDIIYKGRFELERNGEE